MRKFWQIVKYEYTKHVFNKRFIWTVLSLPLMIIGMLVAVLLISYFMMDRSPIGFVDQAGLIPSNAENPHEGNFFVPTLELTAYQSEDEAALALNQEKIQAYFILPSDFEATKEVLLNYRGTLSSDASAQIDEFLRTQFSTSPTKYQERIKAGNNYVLKAMDGSREVINSDWINFVFPFAIGLIFIIVVMTSGGYLLQAVVEEKENRTMEIIVTSVSPMQLMAGKIIGNLSVGLTQLFVWAVFLVLGLFIVGKFIPVIATIDLSGGKLLIDLALLLPAFVFIAGMMAALGATVTDMREAQQVSGFFTIPIFFPYYFSSALITNPNGAIAKFLSYFPLSAPVAMSMRMAFSVVPAWEIFLVLVILVIFSAFTLWLAGRAFRLGMLSYGKKISFKQLLKKEVNHV